MKEARMASQSLSLLGRNIAVLVGVLLFVCPIDRKRQRETLTESIILIIKHVYGG